MTLQKNIIRCIFYYSLLSSTIYSNNTQASDISGNEIFNDIKCGTSELYRDFPMFTTKDWSNTRNAMLKRYSSNIDKYANAPYMLAIQQFNNKMNNSRGSLCPFIHLCHRMAQIIIWTI